MKTDQLLETEKATVAFAFGRFNPAHQGHIEVWRAVEQAGANWFIGTNPSTLGPNDPLTFEQKSAWMAEIYPPISGHIVAEQSVLTLAAYIFKKLRKNENASIAYITDAQDWAWSGKLLNQYNGIEGAHGYYKFAKIIHVPSPRVSSATALRDAARADDKVAFYHASGTDPKLRVAGKTYFDTVKEACEKYPLPVKRSKKVTEMDSQGYTGSRGKKSHSKYGSRDNYELGKGKEHTGTLVKAKDAAKDAEKILNKSYPKTWHDVDPKLGKQVDKMSQAEKVKKGFAHSNTLKKKGVAEGSGGASVRSWANQVRKDHGADVKFWNRREGGGAVDSVIARNSQGETVGVYNRKTGYPTVFEPKQGVAEEKQRLDAKCWDGYKKSGTKMKGDTRVNNCVKEDSLDEYGDTAQGQKMLTKVQKRAVDRVTSKKADTDPAYAKKNKDTADRAWDRMTNVDEEKTRLDPKCWTGYKKQGTKMKGGVRVNNCVKESVLDEKSVSKAQFRTMAAVAHNPEFAKKVGISPAVGKEFHSADKNTDYKKLPKKVDEVLDPTTMSANVLRYLGRKFATAFPWIATGAVGAGLAYSGLLAPIMASAGGAAATITSLGAETALAAGVAGTYAAPSVIQVIKDLFAADENSIQAGIKRWVEKHVGDESDIQEFLNLHAQSAYLKQPVFRWRAEEWKTKMSPKEAEAYLEKHNKNWLDTEKQKVIDVEKAKAEKEKEEAKPGFKPPVKPATESLDVDQKRVGQVAGEEKAKKIGQVLAKPVKQHPYKGRLVGEAGEFNGEYDDEAGMAKSNLLTTARAVAGLLKTIQDNDNLPEWGQEKIAKAEMMLVSIWDYLQSQKEQGIDPKVEGVTEAEIDFGPDWDEIVKRVGQRAKQGPLKTVWDEKKRVYKNVPINDPDQPAKEVDEASLSTMRDYFAGNDDAKDPTKLSQMRDFFNKHKDTGSKIQKKEFNSMASYQAWLKQNGLRDLTK